MQMQHANASGMGSFRKPTWGRHWKLRVGLSPSRQVIMEAIDGPCTVPFAYLLHRECMEKCPICDSSSPAPGSQGTIQTARQWTWANPIHFSTGSVPSAPYRSTQTAWNVHTQGHMFCGSVCVFIMHRAYAYYVYHCVSIYIYTFF